MCNVADNSDEYTSIDDALADGQLAISELLTGAPHIVSSEPAAWQPPSASPTGENATASVNVVSFIDPTRSYASGDLDMLAAQAICYYDANNGLTTYTHPNIHQRGEGAAVIKALHAAGYLTNNAPASLNVTVNNAHELTPTHSYVDAIQYPGHCAYMARNSDGICWKPSHHPDHDNTDTTY